MTEQTEARFLQARQARAQATSAQRLKRTSRNKEQQTAKDFWTFLRRDFENWQSRLDRLQQQESTTVQSKELDRLLQDLYALKTKSLSSNDVMELPAADVRLLHDEFTTRATQLEQVSKQLIPIQKFSFQRYRAAMQQQQQQEEENVWNGTTREKTVAPMSNQDEKPTTALAGNAIENYKNATLVVNSNGDLVVRDEHTEKEHTVHQTEANENASSLLVQNLQHCHVNIHGNYKALHIQNVSFSTIHIARAIEGALHVTACHDVELEACSHQLRIHASTFLKLTVQVQSGPILEDCHDVVFYTTCKDDVVNDTKDFCWLRNGVPSPNFCIILQQETKENSIYDCKVGNGVDNENVSFTGKEQSADEITTVLANENLNTVSVEEDSNEEQDEL